MKKIINALTGRKALKVFTVILGICSILDVFTSFRLGNPINFEGLFIVWLGAFAWEMALNCQDKKKIVATEC